MKILNLSKLLAKNIETLSQKAKHRRNFLYKSGHGRGCGQLIEVMENYLGSQTLYWRHGHLLEKLG